jgi:hypothetical protein
MNNRMQYPMIGFTSFFLVFSSALADPKGTEPPAKPKQIVVMVYKTEKGLRLELNSSIYRNGEYKASDANYVLAELLLREGPNHQIIEVVDDRAPLSALTEVSEMAVNAGFKDIHPFIYWHKTGRMAEIQFGPSIKFSMDGDKIEQEAEKSK